jgi:hypothetical protein
MWPTIRFYLLSLLAAGTLCTQLTYAIEPTPLSRLDSDLAVMNRWLGTGTNGEKWRSYLRHDQLIEQRAKGAAADPEIVEAVLQRYWSDTPGLEQPEFVAVRESLELWLAQLRSPSSQDLIRAVEAAKDQYTEITEEHLQKARGNVRAAQQDLREYLLTGGRNGELWQKFLNWDLLNSQLEGQADPEVVDVIQQQFRSGYRGLEMPVFNRVRRGLERFERILRIRQNENARREFEIVLGRLAETLKALEDDPSEENLELLALYIGWLEERRQVPSLVYAVRRQYGEPNLYVRLSEHLLEAGIAEPVDEIAPVRDVILGTRIRGTGHTKGNISLQLIPSEDQALIETVFVGVTQSRTVGQNGPATIWSRGNTRITGRKRLILDVLGISTSITDVEADTKTRTTGVGTSVRWPFHRLANRIACRKVQEKKWQGERIAARHARQMFADRMEQRAAPMLTNANSAYWDRFRQPLSERGHFPRALHFRTTDDALYVTALQASDSQLAAASPPPKVEGQPDIALRLHESMPNNLAAGLLSGLYIDNISVREQLIETMGTLPERFETEDETDPWSITFADRRPVSVRFHDGNRFSAIIRGKEFSKGEDQYVRGMDVSVEYVMEITERGIKATREGDVEVVPAGWDGVTRFPVRIQTLRQLLKRRFRKIFADELLAEDIKLPEPLDKLGTLVPTQLDANEGWLTVGFRAQADVDAPGGETPGPAVPAGLANDDSSDNNLGHGRAGKLIHESTTGTSATGRTTGNLAALHGPRVIAASIPRKEAKVRADDSIPGSGAEAAKNETQWFALMWTVMLDSAARPIVELLP